MASPVRIERLQELIKQKVSHVVQFELADPRIGLVTITKVKLSKDLSTCIVAYSVLGDESQKSRCKHALEHGRGFVQREVAAALSTRVTPHLTFVYDHAIEGSARVSQLLREVLPEDATADDARAAAEPPPPHDDEPDER